MGVSLRAHPVHGELHIQRHANGEVATKGTRITQKCLFKAQYKADVRLSTQAWASAEIFPGAGKVDILVVPFRLLTIQRKWTFT